MLNLKRGLGALTFALWLGGTSLHAQTGGTGGGATGGGATGGTGGAGGLTGGGGTGGGGTGGSGGTGGTGGQGGGGTGGQGGTGARASAGTSGSASGSGADATNFLSTTYSNPLFMGRPNQVVNFGASSGADAASLSGGTTNSNQSAGGFGQPSFGTTSGTGRSGGTAITSTGLGRTGGAGGLVSFSPSTQASASRIAYTASLKFPVRSLPPSTLQADLRDMLDRSSTIKNAGKIVVLVDQDRNVVIKGKVADDDERRLIMGMLRLTPGVREIQNELIVE